MAVLLHLSPIVVGFFLLGSFCAGIPTYLILRRVGRAGPLALAIAGALLSGLTAMVVLEHWDHWRFCPHQRLALSGR